MPEGHTIHRLAYALAELYGGQRLTVSSPQGRFAAGAARLDGQVLLDAQAHGKHLFVPFAPETDVPVDHAAVTWLRVHLGLYGSWTFDGDATFTAPHAIGAPRRRVGERGEQALAAADASGPSETGAVRELGEEASTLRETASSDVAQMRAPGLADAPLTAPLAQGAGLGRRGVAGSPEKAPGGSNLLRGTEGVGAPHTPQADSSRTTGAVSSGSATTGARAFTPGCRWRAPEPRGAVRLRLLGEHGVADLTGPAACELLDAEGVAAVRRRLGPDPLLSDSDPAEFVAAARRRRKPVGELVMDQSVIAGVGNIYRAEVLFRCRISPFRTGNRISEARLRAVWTDLTVLMADGVATGLIATVDAADRLELVDDDPEAQRWYVYHRAGRACLRCGESVRECDMAGRRLFWCPACQSR